MKDLLSRFGTIKPNYVVKAIELAKSEGDPGNYGIEKEFVMLRRKDLTPLQRVGKQSAYQFLMKYGNLPDWMDGQVTPEAFDYMVEFGTEPFLFVEDAVKNSILMEAELWKATSHISQEFAGVDDILLATGTLPKPAQLTSENIPEAWGEEKREYIDTLVKRYGESLTPQGQHENISVPEPLLAYQYHNIRRGYTKGSIGYTEYKNEVYIRLARVLRAFAPLVIGLGANTPYDYEEHEGRYVTVLSGHLSTRWVMLPKIKSSNHPGMLSDYESFIRISNDLIAKGIIIGSNNYMPVRPKGIDRLGEVPISLERAAWFHDVLITDQIIETDPAFKSLRGKKRVSFMRKLRVAQDAGWLEKHGTNLDEIRDAWHRDNVRRSLGSPLNRLEVRCSEVGGTMEFEIAKAAFLKTIMLYTFCKPDFGSSFSYNDTDMKRSHKNEMRAASDGFEADIEHPFTGKKMKLRQFLSETLEETDRFAREVGAVDFYPEVYEIAKGAPTEAETVIDQTLKKLGKDIRKTRNGRVIVPDEIVRENLELRRYYTLQCGRKLRRENILKISSKEILKDTFYEKLKDEGEENHE